MIESDNTAADALSADPTSSNAAAGIEFDQSSPISEKAPARNCLLGAAATGKAFRSLLECVSDIDEPHSQRRTGDAIKFCLRADQVEGAMGVRVLLRWCELNAGEEFPARRTGRVAARLAPADRRYSCSRRRP